jgi:hypothetical protein
MEGVRKEEEVGEGGWSEEGGRKKDGGWRRRK